MAISKLILNGDVQMDVTSNTNAANNMLNGVIGTKNDGTSITGNIATKSSADLTASGSVVTAPAGYYATSATKSVTEGSAFPPAVTITKNPTFSINSSTAVVTASYAGSSSITPTVSSGYISQGTAGTIYTTGTSTYTLTSKAAATIYPSTADQTISSYRWLTGTQTIKSVTTSNLTASNIAEGVVVKVGDSANASRITQITGTHSGATSYTATINGSGNSSYCYVTYNGTKYYTNGNTFTFKAGDTLTIYCRGNNVIINGQSVALSSYSYTYTLPVGNITINLSYLSSTSNNIAIYGLVQPSGTYSVSAAGNHNVYNYSITSVPTGSAFSPATTITTNPTFTFVSSTGKITAAYTGASSITPTITSGYISQGTAGTISTTGTSTYTLTTQAAQTFYPSTADQTVASYMWLTGTQTFKSVTTTNLTASNIAEGVVVKVGDSTNASRITQITGTHSGVSTYTATITGTGTTNACYVSYNNIKYYSAGTFQFIPGNNLYVYLNTPYDNYRKIYLNGLPVGNRSGEAISYNMTLQSYDTIITLGGPIYITTPTISITSSGFYDVTNYANANVDIADSSAQIIRWIEV